MVSVVPRVGSFGAPYKHNNNAKQAHFWKLQLQNFTTCLICIRRVKIPSFGSCHVFLITADWFWTSELCEANTFVVTCCKCLRHAKTHCQLHRWNWITSNISKYSSIVHQGTFLFATLVFGSWLAALPGKNHSSNETSFYFAGLQQMNSKHKAASFQDFEQKSEVQSNLKQLPLLSLYRSASKDACTGLFFHII